MILQVDDPCTSFPPQKCFLDDYRMNSFGHLATGNHHSYGDLTWLTITMVINHVSKSWDDPPSTVRRRQNVAWNKLELVTMQSVVFQKRWEGHETSTQVTLELEVKLFVHTKIWVFTPTTGTKLNIYNNNIYTLYSVYSTDRNPKHTHILWCPTIHINTVGGRNPAPPGM